MKAYLSIQCRAPNGETGVFLTGEAGDLLTPVLADCAAFFPWAKANGWRDLPYDPAHPVGVYRRVTADDLLSDRLAIFCSRNGVPLESADELQCQFLHTGKRDLADWCGAFVDAWDGAVDTECGVGDRVQLKAPYDVYPTGVFEAGLTGVVVALVCDDDMSAAHFAVKLDREFPALAEWDNVLQILFSRATETLEPEAPIARE